MMNLKKTAFLVTFTVLVFFVFSTADNPISNYHYLADPTAFSTDSTFYIPMAYEDAKKMYNLFNEELISRNINVQTGEFGEDMKVTFTNDGPVTITIDSEVDL